jgi:hypothetical protein
MKSAPILLTVVGYASAIQTQHEIPKASVFSSQAQPVDFDHIGALGESFHNAWQQCHHLTHEYIIDELKVKEEDPYYSNSYAVEYGLTKKVPQIYSIFQELMG